MGCVARRRALLSAAALALRVHSVAAPFGAGPSAAAHGALPARLRIPGVCWRLSKVTYTLYGSIVRVRVQLYSSTSGTYIHSSCNIYYM